MGDNFKNPWGNNDFFKKFDDKNQQNEEKTPNDKKNEQNKNKDDTKRYKPQFFNNGQFNNVRIFKKINGFALLAIILFLWLLNGIYKIDTNQQGVVLYFGKFYKIAEPGLNYMLPYPIGNLYKVPVTNINKEEFGFRSAGNVTNMDNESLMLTGDENIVDIDFEVQWRIKSATDYIFNVQNPALTIRMATESAMREIIGKRKIDDALATKKSEIENEVLVLLQQILDSYKSGIEIQEILDNYKSGIEILLVQLLRVDPPKEVIAAVRDVQTANADKERKINEAETYRNDIIPKARGEAESIIKSAEGYKESTIKNAEGEVAYFKNIYKEYVKNPVLTKKRIYLETMENVMKNVDKTIINDTVGENILQHLPINSK